MVTVAALLSACGSEGGKQAESGPTGDGEDYPRLDPAVEERVDELLGDMTLEEKVAQMHGTGVLLERGMWPTPDVERLDLPGLRMVDGPRGVSGATGAATTFPVGMARAATWDVELEREVGAVIGAETEAKGGHVLLAPTINILRHPAWGRAQETYGEDPFLMTRMGVAFIQGAQEHVMASAKHYAVNSIDDTRFDVDVKIDERSLREVYLPHFRAAVREANVASVMSAYNQVNGFYCSENEPLLSQILKGDWEFTGFVESDWVQGTRSTVPSVSAGLDIEMPFPSYLGEDLINAVNDGDIDEAKVDGAARRILRRKLEYGVDSLSKLKTETDLSQIETAESIALTREVAQKSMVLLKNQGSLLPLASSQRIAVVGVLADELNLGDKGSSAAKPSAGVTAWGGISARATDTTLVPTDTPSTEELSAIADAEVAIVVTGLTNIDEGEAIGDRTGGDRERLNLSPEQEALITTVAAANDQTLVVLQGGSAITMQSWIDDVPALLMSWYPGMEGGTALADLVFGDVSPSGKLPLTIPVDDTQLPTWPDDDLVVTYDYFHGYWFVDRVEETPLFPFGFGLSYASFSYEALDVSAGSVSKTSSLDVTVTVTNTSSVAGDEVVQLYVGAANGSIERPERALKGFARVSLAPGESKPVTIPLRGRDLATWDVDAQEWVLEATDYELRVGGSSRALPLSSTISGR